MTKNMVGSVVEIGFGVERGVPWFTGPGKFPFVKKDIGDHQTSDVVDSTQKRDEGYTAREWRFVCEHIDNIVRSLGEQKSCNTSRSIDPKQVENILFEVGVRISPLANEGGTLNAIPIQTEPSNERMSTLPA